MITFHHCLIKEGGGGKRKKEGGREMAVGEGEMVGGDGVGTWSGVGVVGGGGEVVIIFYDPGQWCVCVDWRHSFGGPVDRMCPPWFIQSEQCVLLMLTWPGLTSCDLTWLGLMWPDDLILCDLAWYCVTWPGLILCDLNWPYFFTWPDNFKLCNLTWLGLMWSDLVRPHTIWLDLTLWDLTRLDLMWYDLIWLELMWPDLAWPYVTWPGLTICDDLVWYGTWSGLTLCDLT